MGKKKWNKEKIILEIQRISKELNRKPKKRECSQIYATARNLFGTWNNAIESAGFEIKKFQKPKVPKKLDPDLSYFMGLLITDGHIVIEKRGSAKIMIFTSYPEEREIILKLIKQLFDYKASVRTKKYGFNKKPNFEIYISSKKLANYLVSTGIPSGHKSYTVRVPKCFFDNIKLNTYSFIRGVIDGDGHVNSKGKFITISSGSLNFLEDFKKLFQRIKIKTSEIRYSKTSNTKELRLSGIENLRKLRSFLYSGGEYNYPRKKESWKNI